MLPLIGCQSAELCYCISQMDNCWDCWRFVHGQAIFPHGEVMAVDGVGVGAGVVIYSTPTFRVVILFQYGCAGSRQVQVWRVGHLTPSNML